MTTKKTKRTTDWAGFDETLATAKVLALVRSGNVNADEIHVTAYHNGREHGYAFDAFTYSGGGIYWVKAVVCNVRNGDGLLVYVGAKGDFDKDDVPCERAYREAKRFTYGQAASAAKAIRQHLSGYGFLR